MQSPTKIYLKFIMVCDIAKNAIFKCSYDERISIIYQESILKFFDNEENNSKLFIGEIRCPLKNIKNIFLTKSNKENDYFAVLINNKGESANLLIQLNNGHPVIIEITGDFLLPSSFTNFYQISKHDFIFVESTINNSNCIFKCLGIICYTFNPNDNSLSVKIVCQCRSSVSTKAGICKTIHKYEILCVDSNSLTIHANSNIWKFCLNNCSDYIIFDMDEIHNIKKLYWIDNDNFIILTDMDLLIVNLIDNKIARKFCFSHGVLDFSHLYCKNFYYLTCSNNNQISLNYSRHISESEKCIKILETGDILTAIEYCSKNNLDSDLVYKYLWEKSPKTDIAFFDKINDFNYVIYVCLNIDSLPLNLFENILQKTFKSGKLHGINVAASPCEQYLERLFIFNLFNNYSTEFPEKFYYFFRSCSIFYTCCQFLKLALIDQAVILFQFYSPFLKNHYLPLLTLIPETTQISALTNILPKIKNNVNIYPLKSCEKLAKHFINEIELPFIDKFYSENSELLKFQGNFEHIDISSWYLYRCTQIDSLSGLTNLAYNLFSVAISNNIPFNHSVRTDLDTAYHLIYFYEFEFSFHEFLQKNISEKFILIVSKSTSDLSQLLEIFFLNYPNAFESIDTWIDYISEETLLNMIHNHKKYHIDPNFIVDVIYQLFSCSRFNSPTILSTFFKYINKPSVNLKKYQNLNIYRRILNTLSNLTIDSINIRFLDLIEPSKNFHIFNQFFLCIDLNHFIKNDLSISELINCIVELNESESIYSLKNFFSISLSRCQCARDIEIVYDIFLRSFDFNNISTEPLDDILLECSNEFLTKCNNYKDMHYLLASKSIYLIQKSSDNVENLRGKIIACDKIFKICPLFDIKNLMNFSNLTVFLNYLLNKFSSPKTYKTNIIEILGHITNLSPDACELKVLEMIIKLMFDKNAYETCVDLCERLSALNHPNTWWYFYQLSKNGTQIPKYRRLEFAEFAISLCPTFELRNTLINARSLRCTMIDEKREKSLLPFDKSAQFYFNLLDSEVILNKILMDSNKNLNILSCIGYYIDETTILHGLSKNLIPLSFIDQILYFQCLRYLYKKGVHKLSFDSCLDLLRSQPSIVSLIIESFDHHSEALNALIQWKREAKIYHTVKKFNSGIVFSQPTSENSGKKYASESSLKSPIYFVFEKLEKICLSGKNHKRLNEILFSDSFVRNINDLQIDKNIIIDKMRGIFSLPPCANLSILLEWLKFSQELVCEDCIIFGGLSLSQHIHNIKRMRATLHDLDYFSLYNGNTLSLAVSLRETNIYSVAKLFSENKINGLAYSKVQLFSMYILKTLKTIEESTEDLNLNSNVTFLSNLWGYLQHWDIKNIIDTIFFTDSNLGNRRLYLLSDYFYHIFSSIFNNSSEILELLLPIKPIYQFYSNLNEIELSAKSTEEYSVLRIVKFPPKNSDLTFDIIFNILQAYELSPPFLSSIINLYLIFLDLGIEELLTKIILKRLHDLTTDEYQEPQIYAFVKNISTLSHFYDLPKLTYTIECVLNSLVNKADISNLKNNTSIVLKSCISCFSSETINKLGQFYETKMYLSVFWSPNYAVSFDMESSLDLNYRLNLFESLLEHCHLPRHLLALSNLIKIWLKNIENAKLFSSLIQKYFHICIENFDSPSLLMDVFSLAKELDIIDGFASTDLYTNLWSKRYYVEAVRLSLVSGFPDLIEFTIFDMSCLKDTSTVQTISNDPFINESYIKLEIASKIFTLENKIFYYGLVNYCLKQNTFQVIQTDSHPSYLYNSLQEQLLQKGFYDEVDRLKDVDSQSNFFTSALENFRNIARKFT
ncbi:hypothetical protein HZS_36 [Henneguya salminicola]|nr:hypothetical protein HZS_36 [Henneguya salminicola]